MPVIGGRAHNVEQIIEVCRQGYEYAEISLLDPDEIESSLDELVRIRDSYGIYYLAHYPNEGNPVDLDAHTNVFIPKMKSLIDLTAALGIQKGTMHFWIDRRWGKESLIRSKIELLADLSDYADQRDVTLCLENLSERHESFSPAFLSAPCLRMTLDIGHGELLASRNTSFGFIENVFKKIAHIHVHDNHGGKGVRDDLHLALGEGRVDYPGIFSLLQEKGYDSTITMEVQPDDMARTKEKIMRYF